MTRLGWICHPTLEGADGALEQARAAEEAGLHTLVVSDEVLGRSPGTSLFPLLASLLDVTASLTILPLISDPIVRREPLEVARDISGLARSAPGRLILGLTVGDPAHDPVHVPNWERMSRMARVLPALRALLAGEEVTEDGPHVRIHGRLEDPPRAPVPIWLLADGPSSAAMAARADGVLLEPSDTAHGDVLEPFRAAVPATAPIGVLSGAPTVQEAIERGRSIDAWLLAVRSDGDPIEGIRAITSEGGAP